MTQRRETGEPGSLLSEQTVLSFSPTPPSLSCSSVLPSSVCDKRGGETGFAMNQRTQLQFNLGVPPHHEKLATKMDPSSQPSPVCIQTLGAETIGISHTPAQTFKAASPETLAIAMKLAKRNAKIKVQFDSCDEEEDDVELSDDYVEVLDQPMDYEDWAKLHPYSAAGKKTSRNTDQVKKPRQYTRHQDTRHQDTRHQAAGHQTPGHQTPGHQDTRQQDTRQQGTRQQGTRQQGTRQQGTRQQGTRQQGTRQQDTRQKPIPPPELIAREIAQLKLALNQRLRSKKARKPDWQDPDRKVVRDGVPLEEPQRSEEQEQQRKEEQHARNSRMIYDLSQQVKGLRQQVTAKKPQSAQSVIVQKLAAAQRAALRTLQGYSRHGQTLIPPQLTFLIQQLGLLSNQLGGGVNNELSTDLYQLMGNLDNQRPVSVPITSSHPSMRDSQRKVAAASKKYASGKTKNTGAVLYSCPRGGYKPDNSTHFTDPTFTSARRKEPLHPYTPPRGYQESPRGSSQAISECSHPQRYPVHSPKVESVTKRKKARGPSQSSSKAVKSLPTGSANLNTNKKKQMKKKGKKSKVVVFDDNTGGLESLSPLPDGEESLDFKSAMTKQADQLQSLRTEISQKLAEMKSGFDQREAKRMAQLSISTPQLSIPTPQLSIPTSQLSIPTPTPIQPQPPTSQPPIHQAGSKSPQFSDSRLPNMLIRLGELEIEEEAIRQRWNTIVYEDPLATRSSKKMAVSLERGVSLPSLSSESLSSIKQYKQQYSHYLATTGVSTQGGFNPWDMAEGIADNILGETLEGVASEVELVCDHCVEELYSNEFIRPP